MIKFFRKIRQKFLMENKFSKYILYAVGEIILVVIGILIALQINNANEANKLNKQVTIYKQSLITELNEDFKSLNELDSLCTIYTTSINNYVDYYNSENPNLEKLVLKLDSIQKIKSNFTTRTYTIQDLITTGNLSLFPTPIKNAILQLKDTQETNSFYEKKSIEILVNKEQVFENSIDFLFAKDFTKKEHNSVKNWKYNLDSKQYRLNNNRLAGALNLFNYQIIIHERIRKDSKILLELLENKSKK
jgi:hypothetical protein